jgi:hypothetical protein
MQRTMHQARVYPNAPAHQDFHVPRSFLQSLVRFMLAQPWPHYTAGISGPLGDPSAADSAEENAATPYQHRAAPHRWRAYGNLVLYTATSPCDSFSILVPKTAEFVLWLCTGFHVLLAHVLRVLLAHVLRVLLTHVLRVLLAHVLRVLLTHVLRVLVARLAFCQIVVLLRANLVQRQVCAHAF